MLEHLVGEASEHGPHVAGRARVAPQPLVEREPAAAPEHEAESGDERERREADAGAAQRLEAAIHPLDGSARLVDVQPVRGLVQVTTPPPDGPQLVALRGGEAAERVQGLERARLLRFPPRFPRVVRPPGPGPRRVRETLPPGCARGIHLERLPEGGLGAGRVVALAPDRREQLPRGHERGIEANGLLQLAERVGRRRGVPRAAGRPARGGTTAPRETPRRGRPAPGRARPDAPGSTRASRGTRRSPAGRPESPSRARRRGARARGPDLPRRPSGPRLRAGGAEAPAAARWPGRGARATPPSPGGRARSTAGSRAQGPRRSRSGSAASAVRNAAAASASRPSRSSSAPRASAGST